MPSRASSETNSRADSAPSRSASRSKPSSTAAVVSAFDAASPCGEPRPMSATSDRDRGLDVVGGHRDQPDRRGGGGVERLAGQVVAGGGAGGQLRQQRQRDDRRRDPDPGLGQREGAARTGDGDVACADQSHAAGTDVAVDRDDHRQRRLDDGAQQRRPSPGPAAAAASRGIRARWPPSPRDRSAPAQKVLPVWPSTTARTAGSAAASRKPWCSWPTSVARQRVAVVRRVQRQPRDDARRRRIRRACPSVATGAGPATSARRS